MRSGSPQRQLLTDYFHSSGSNSISGPGLDVGDGAAGAAASYHLVPATYD